jgi:cytochrome P450/alpha/beta superfamily hydrolase
VVAGTRACRGKRLGVNEHPLLVPTSVGTLAGIVAEPAGDPRAAAVLLPGSGGPGRAGVNAFWTRVARGLAERGILTLRFDYPHRGNGSSPLAADVDVDVRAEMGEDVDVAALLEVTAWFRRRLGGLDMFVAGECHGARLALELLPHDREVAGVFAVAPYLRDRFVPLSVREEPGSLDEEGIEILDARMRQSLREFLELGRPAWVLIGGLEGEDPFRLQRRLGEPGHRLEIEVVPGFKIHPVASPEVQAQVGARLTRRIVRALEQRRVARRPSLPPGPDLPPARQAARWAMRQLAFLEEMRARYGEVFTVRLLGEEPLVVVGDPELVRQVIAASPDVLQAGEGNRRVLGPLLGEHSLFLLDGERHLSHRRLLLPPFHGRCLERCAETMRTTVEAQLAAWPEGEPVAALPRMRTLSLAVMMRTVFGIGEAERPALRDALLALRLPANADDGESPAFRAAVERAEALIAEEVARRRSGSRPEQGDDVLALLLGSRLEDDSPLSEAEVRAELMTLIVAGTETTAGSLAWALERLAHTPEALDRAVEEATAGGGPYIDAAIYETLRMRPVLPTFARLAKQPFALGEHLVPAGTRIALSVLLVHHRADVYPEPMAFRPERFLGNQPGTYTWIPFGGGVRRCIGASFALMEMRIVLGALLSRMTLRAPGPEAEGMRNRAVMTVPSRQAEVILEPRRAAALPLAAGESA